MTKRKRRSFTAEFKADAVRLVRSGERTIGQVAKDLDLTETSLRGWVRRAEELGEPTPTASKSEQEELKELRKRVKRLEAEREILKKAAVRSIGQGNADAKASSGVWKANVFLGRVFNWRAVRFSSACE